MALDSLPTELVEIIADRLDLQSVCSFRLANVTLNQQYQHGFKQRFFRKRTVRWEIASLQQLDEVTSNPHYEGLLEELLVDATPRFAIRMWGLEKAIIDAAAHRDFNKRDRLALIYARLGEESGDAAKYWNETRQDQKILASVFGRLNKLQSITFAYDGMEKDHLLFGRRYCEKSQNEMSRPFVSTMTALATAHLPVRSIGMDAERRYGAISIGRLESISPVLANFEAAISKLENLQLSLRDWRHPDEGFELPAGRAPFVVRFLSKFRNLRNLELSCFSSLETDILPDMAKHCRFPKMETCRLDLLRIENIDNLFDFLGPSKGSLRLLALSHMVLKDEQNDWSQVLRRLACDLALESAELRTLFMSRGNRVGFCNIHTPASFETMRGSCFLEGPDIKDQLIAQADRLVTLGWGPAWHRTAIAYPFMGFKEVTGSIP